MSYLDNLESNLKALESQEERDPDKRARDLAAKEAQREAALQLAPYVEALKNGPYTHRLLTSARTIGHAMRVFVDFAWIETTLRFEARGRRLELRPTALGIQAVYLENGATVRTEALDLEGDAEQLMRSWLES